MRLTRVGAKNDPRYRIVVADARTRRDGRFLEILGYYHPTRQPEVVHINKERALYWLSVGAQPTETVVRLLAKLGIWQEFHRLKKERKQATKTP